MILLSALNRYNRNFYVPYWYPTTPFEATREMWRGVHRDASINRACDFYTKRNLWALARLWDESTHSKDTRILSMVHFAITGTMQAASKMNRHRPKYVPSILMGTLYVGSFVEESNILRLLSPRIEKSLGLMSILPKTETCAILCEHAGYLNSLVDSSIDYIFTDPPFGSNIFYGDCSFLPSGRIHHLWV